MWMKKPRPKIMPPENVGGQKQDHFAGGGARLEWCGSARPALCDITGEGGLQENVPRVTCCGIFLFDYCSRQLRREQHAAQGSYQFGLSFAELSRKVLVVRVGTREDITGTWCTTSCIAGDLGCV
jgi:hypothetical protein